MEEGQQLDERETLLKKVMSYGFAEKDLALFLDTHPQDKKALLMHREVAKKFKALQDEYEQKYGPLTAASASRGDTWKWIENPWPWENERRNS